MVERNDRLLFLAGGFTVGVVFAGILFLIISSGGQPIASSQNTVMSIFSPDNGDEIIKAIESANSSLDIEIYTFSSEDALNAVLYAHDKGVKIRMIIEERIVSETNEKTYDKLKAAGIEVRWASKEYALTHAKFMIIDGKLVLVGSHNWSKNALKKNREASVLVSGAVVDDFEKVFEKDWGLA